MTCIVALKHESKVYIGGDSAGVDGWDYTVVKHPKVFRLGDMLIGYSGSNRMAQILRYHVTPPKHYPEDGDGMAYMVKHFVECLRTTFKEHGYSKTESGVETMDSEIVVGYRGEIYAIQTDFQVAVSAAPYRTSGIGRSYALGAMAMSEFSTNLPPDNRVLKALEISGQFSNGVCGPYYVEVL